MSKNDFELVDIRSGAYKDFLIPDGTGSTQERVHGGGYLLDKKTADELMRYAQTRNVKLIYNSAYRVEGLEVGAKGGGTVKSGVAHATAMSIDLKTVVGNHELENGQVTKAVLEKTATKAESDARLCRMGSDIQTSKDMQLFWGGTAYLKAGNVDIRDLTYDGQIFKVNMGEVQHFESIGSRDMDISLRTRAVKEFNEKVRETRQDDRDVPTRIIIKNGQTSFGYDDEAGKYEYVNGQKYEIAAPEILRDLMAADSIKSISMTSKAAGASDGKTAGNASYINLIRTPPSIPRDLSAYDSGDNKAINIDTQQLKNLRNVSEADYKINTHTHKLIKNAFGNKLPFGQQDKHDGPDAAIKLVLDKLFEDRLTPSAIKAWEDIKSSGIDYIDNFIIERITKVSEERYNISQSISDEYKIYFSGRRPTVMSVSGKLLNTYNQQWWYDFEYFYDNFLRGSKAVENRIRAFLTISDAVYEIIILKFAVNGDSAFDSVLMFNLDYILLQTMYTGEYKNPVTRGGIAMQNIQTPMSLSQTDLSPEMRGFIDNYSQVILGAAGGGMAAGYAIALDPDAEINKASSREDLKDSDYANLTKQILLNKSNINAIDELDLKNISDNGSLFASPGHFGESINARTQPASFSSDNINAYKYNNTTALKASPTISNSAYVNIYGDELEIAQIAHDAFSINSIPPVSYDANMPNNLRAKTWGQESNNNNININAPTLSQVPASYTQASPTQEYSPSFTQQAMDQAKHIQDIALSLHMPGYSWNNTEKISNTVSNPAYVKKTIGEATPAEANVNMQLGLRKSENAKITSAISRSLEAWRNGGMR